LLSLPQRETNLEINRLNPLVEQAETIRKRRMIAHTGTCTACFSMFIVVALWAWEAGLRYTDGGVYFRLFVGVVVPVAVAGLSRGGWCGNLERGLSRVLRSGSRETLSKNRLF